MYFIEKIILKQIRGVNYIKLKTIKLIFYVKKGKINEKIIIKLLTGTIGGR